MSDADRCLWAIKFGVTLRTRCDWTAGHGIDMFGADAAHVGKGLAEFPYQRIEWFPGDRRAFETDRDDEFAWEDWAVG